MIIVDENVDESLLSKLKEYTSKVISIREEHSGITDEDVIMIAKSIKGLVTTEDKDFGELIFSYNIRGCSVMLLRYDKSNLIAMTGLRNILVHEYVAVDTDQLYKLLERLNDFNSFASQVCLRHKSCRKLCFLIRVEGGS